MNANDRTAEILHAVDELIRRVALWKDDPAGDAMVPGDIATAIDGAVMICADGDVPQMCRQLASEAVPAMYEANRRYEANEHGYFRPETGAPDQPWWKAIIAVEQARLGAVAPVYESIEPVAVLRKQGVTDEQIALSIYGRRGEGPFVNSSGSVNYALIQKEVDQPGSVIPEGWIPPWVDQALAESRKAVQNRLKSYAIIAENKRYEDPSTVEELLRDGAYVQQIMNVKHLTRKEVLAEADRLGVKAVDAPGAEIDWRDNVNAPVPATASTDPSVSGESVLKPLACPETGLDNTPMSLAEMAAEVLDRTAPQAKSDEEDEAMAGLVIEEYERSITNGNELGAAELSEAMGGALVVKPSRVSEILAEHKRAKRKELAEV